MPEVLALIKELATFEMATKPVEATESMLQQTFSFSPSCRQRHEQPRRDGGTEHADDGHGGYAKALLLYLPAKPSSAGGDNDDLGNAGAEVVVGMALYYHTYSSRLARPGIFLEDLIIRPPFRRLGYASLLLRELAREIQHMGGKRLEWTCLDWNEGALKFYEGEVRNGGCGAKRPGGSIRLQVEGDGLTELAEGRSALIDMDE